MPAPFQNVLRTVLVGFGRVGARAATAAVQSAMKDGDSIVAEGQRVMSEMRKQWDALTGGAPHPDGDTVQAPGRVIQHKDEDR